MAKRRRAGSRPGVLVPLIKWLWWLLRGTIRHAQPVVAAACIAAAGAGLWHAVCRSDTFQVTAVELPEDAGLTVPEGIVGQNLWSVNLRWLAETLHAQRPQLKWVRVVRVPPHTLRVEMQERAPLAQVQIGKPWYPVDADGYIFPAPSDKPVDGLMALKGVTAPKAKLRAGRENRGERLERGLRVAMTLRRAGALKGHQVTLLDVSDPKQSSFVLDNAMEIRCGAESELVSQLLRLRVVLQRVSREPFPIRYIDVRFPEPVVGPKT